MPTVCFKMIACPTHKNKSDNHNIRVFTHGAIGCQIDFIWWTHWAIFHSSQCSMTGVTKAMVCVVLSVGVLHVKEPLMLIGKSSPYSGSSGFPLSMYEWSFTICLTPYNHIKNVLSALLNKIFTSLLFNTVFSIFRCWDTRTGYTKEVQSFQGTHYYLKSYVEVRDILDIFYIYACFD